MAYALPILYLYHYSWGFIQQAGNKVNLAIFTKEIFDADSHGIYTVFRLLSSKELNNLTFTLI